MQYEYETIIFLAGMLTGASLAAIVVVIGYNNGRKRGTKIAKEYFK